LALSANPDILRMVIGRLRMRIEQGTATILCKILCKIKSHTTGSEPLNETADDLADLGRTIDQEHAVWTTRSNRMVFSWMDGQKSARTSIWNHEVKNGVRLGAGPYRFEARLQQGVRNWLQGWRALPSGVDRVISTYRSMVKPEELGSRNHGEVESGITLGTTYGYMDERLPLPRRGRQRSRWGAVERQDCPMASAT
jgi:hypothetical protein